MKRPRIQRTIVVCLCVLVLVVIGVAVSNRFSANVYPETVDIAADIIIKRLSDEDRLLIKNTKKEDLINFHHGWGTSIRNDFGLWDGNEKLLRSACHGEICDPDEASMVIIEAVWMRLQK